MTNPENNWAYLTNTLEELQHKKEEVQWKEDVSEMAEAFFNRIHRLPTPPVQNKVLRFPTRMRRTWSNEESGSK